VQGSVRLKPPGVEVQACDLWIMMIGWDIRPIGWSEHEGTAERDGWGGIGILLQAHKTRGIDRCYLRLARVSLRFVIDAQERGWRGGPAIDGNCHRGWYSGIGCTSFNGPRTILVEEWTPMLWRNKHRVCRRNYNGWRRDDRRGSHKGAPAWQ